MRVISPPRVRLAAVEIGALTIRYWRTLFATTKVELAKRYSGTALGLFWVILYPSLLLGIYLFVYMVVFKVRFPGYSEFGYVLYVFAGLIPYLGVMDALSTGTMSVKQNIHLVKNVMFPIELIPVRAVLVSISIQLVSLTVLIIMSAIGGTLGPQLLLLPLVLLLQYLMLLGIVYILAALAVALIDISYFVNLALLLLLFISPIGFRPEMVPAGFDAMIWLNPVHYMSAVFRAVTVSEPLSGPAVGVIYVAVSLVFFVAGCAFFRRFKNILVDYE